MPEIGARFITRSGWPKSGIKLVLSKLEALLKVSLLLRCDRVLKELLLWEKLNLVNGFRLFQLFWKISSLKKGTRSAKVYFFYV